MLFDDRTDELFYRQLREISGLLALLPYGRFQLPKHHLGYHTAVTSKSGKFLKSVEGNFLSQVLSEPARKDALPDLLFMNRGGLVAVVGGSLGHSGHIMFEFEVFGAMRKKVIRVDTLDFKRANFKLLRELFSSVPRESAFEGSGVHECWSVLKNHLLKSILLCRRSSKRGRIPASLNRELLLEPKRKKKLCDL